MPININKSLHRLIDILGSRRFAVYILVVTLLIIFLSNFLPKPYIMSSNDRFKMKLESPLLYDLAERFNVGAITDTPFFYAVVVFLFTSVTICTTRRIKERSSQKKASLISGRTFFESTSSKKVNGRVDEEALLELIKKKGWKPSLLNKDGKRLLYGDKGMPGFWGSIIFHVGMCIVMIGAMISSSTRYNGSLVLTEDFPLNPTEVLAGLSPDKNSEFPVKELMLSSFHASYEGYFPVEYKAGIRFIDSFGSLSNETIEVNDPLEVGYYQFMLSAYGYAPRFTVRGSDGNILTEDVVVLDVIMPGMIDRFELLNGKYEAEVRFYPDFVREAETGKYKTKSRDLNNPVFLISLKDADGKEIGEGRTTYKRPFFFDEYSIELVDVNYWARLDVSRDQGRPWIAIGFFFIVAGLAGRLIFTEKRLWIIMEADSVSVGGRCRYFPALFETELDSIAEKIKINRGYERDEQS